jgi:hypothetical protein
MWCAKSISRCYFATKAGFAIYGELEPVEYYPARVAYSAFAVVAAEFYAVSSDRTSFIPQIEQFAMGSPLVIQGCIGQA